MGIDKTLQVITQNKGWFVGFTFLYAFFGVVGMGLSESFIKGLHSRTLSLNILLILSAFAALLFSTMVTCDVYGQVRKTLYKRDTSFGLSFKNVSRLMVWGALKYSGECAIALVCTFYLHKNFRPFFEIFFSFLSFFILPHLVFAQEGVFKAFKKSASLMIKVWSQTIEPFFLFIFFPMMGIGCLGFLGIKHILVGAVSLFLVFAMGLAWEISRAALYLENTEGTMEHQNPINFPL